MRITTVLFDLDGTLLPMNQDTFMKAYFGSLCKRIIPLGYKQDELIAAIWSGTKAMVKNDGSKNNEDAFWCEFKKHYPDFSDEHYKEFEKYYIEDFDSVSSVSVPDPAAKEALELIKAKGLRCALATNPLFPSIATEKRIRWAGFEPSEFELFTTYETSHYAKPSLDYYLEITKMLGVSPEECLMVGNDADEDMCVTELGMKVFLITDNIINKSDKDISVFPNGSFKNLIEFIKEQA